MVIHEVSQKKKEKNKKEKEKKFAGQDLHSHTLGLRC